MSGAILVQRGASVTVWGFFWSELELWVKAPKIGRVTKTHNAFLIYLFSKLFLTVILRNEYNKRPLNNCTNITKILQTLFIKFHPHFKFRANFIVLGAGKLGLGHFLKGNEADNITSSCLKL